MRVRTIAMKFARRRQNYIFEVFAGVVRSGYEVGTLPILYV